VFQATGRTIEFPGYLRAYVEGADDPEAELEDRETILPPLEEGATVECRELKPSGHTTQPPARYTEASLVKELEDRGIGRPSTYASVIETILRRDYAFKKGSALVPTWTAFAKVQLLERYFSHLIDYEFTATMEEALDAIARGEGEAEKWLHSFYFGNGQVGLRDLVAEEHLAQIDKAEVNAVHIGVDGDGRELVVRVWPNGANIERGEEKGPVPADLAPDELTPEKADELLALPTGPREVGTDPETGLTVLVLTGRFGPFVQLGEQEPGSKQKPKRASLFASMDPGAVTLEQALALLSLPRVVGVDDDGEEITAQNGRYGPYLKKANDSRSLGSEDELFSVTMEQAKGIFAQPKQRRGRGAAKPPLAELGAHPESGAPIRVLDGRFGPYITDGTVNASVPRGTDPETVSLEQAVELLRERAARAPAKKQAPAKRAPKKATKKATKRASPPKSTTTRTVKKRAAKKATAKKAASTSTRSATKPPAPGT
jgi:DNA topoisomerase I